MTAIDDPQVGCQTESMMEREQMQTITVDGEAQAAWLSEVRRFHSKVELLALDAAGAVHTLMEINQKTSFWRLFHGPVSHVVLATSLGVTRWPCACVPTELLHIRVDERGQPEVWSGSMAVVKHFGAEAAPGDWLTGPGLFTANTDLRQTARLIEADGTGRRCHG